MKIYTNVTTMHSKMLVRYFDVEKGKSFKKKVDFAPSLFVPAEKNEGYKSIHGLPLRRLEFHEMNEYWEFRKRYNEMQSPIYGDINPAIQFIADFHPKDQVVPLDYVRIFDIDIEVLHGDEFPNPEKADRPINLINLHDSKTNTMHSFGLEYAGCGSWAPGEMWANSDYRFDYNGYYTEEALLEAFIAMWATNCPDIITGWYTEGFDIPYLINRIEKVLGEGASKALSPWGIITDKYDNYQKKKIYNIVGISHLDYMRAYLKYSYSPQENYKLNTIAYAELNDSKVSYDEYSSLPELYRTNYQKFVDYGIKDVDIVQRLEAKRGFLDLIVSMAYYSKINFDDVAFPIRIWDSLIYNHLREQGIQINPDNKSYKKEKYEGAYVKDPQVGRHSWIVSIDLASEYPSLMRGINISPDTLVDDYSFFNEVTVDRVLNKEIDTASLKEKNSSLASNGTLYRRDKQGFLPILLTALFEGRKADKQKMLECQAQAEKAIGAEKDQLKKKAGLYHTQQYAKKILLNSAYGALGAEFFRWFDVRLAEAVTSSGQTAIRWVERYVNEYFNKVLDTQNIDYAVYIDTDSVYLSAEAIVNKFMPGETDNSKIVDKLDKFFAEKVSLVIKKAYADLFEYMNHRDQLMFMDREVIADKAIFCTKKHYFMRVHDSEGIRYTTPKMKIMGMGFIKSDIPEFCRKHCKETMVQLALDGTNETFVEAIDQFENEFLQRKPEEIARSIGVSNIDKYLLDEDSFVKGAPIGSKSAIIYNALRKKHNLGSQHPEAKENDRIKYLWLKPANPIGQETVGFLDFLPEEFNLDKYIDRELMFEKSFIGPVSEILDAMQWNRNIVSSLF